MKVSGISLKYFMTKDNFIYMGIDLHKETHTAVMIDCNNKLGEISFANRPADFTKQGNRRLQAMILISRRLISIIYGMLKNKTGYVMPKAQDKWD